MTRDDPFPTALYDFQGGDDGAGPVADLLEYRGTFYGTTTQGGGNGEGTACKPPIGCGTVFAFTPDRIALVPPETPTGSPLKLHRYSILTRFMEPPPFRGQPATHL